MWKTLSLGFSHQSDNHLGVGVNILFTYTSFYSFLAFFAPKRRAGSQTQDWKGEAPAEPRAVHFTH
jgi:hypothetical protein